MTRKLPTTIWRRAIVWPAALLVLATSLGGVLALTRIASMSYLRGELQGHADRTALEVAETLARQADMHPTEFSRASGPITLGQWDATRRQFRPGSDGTNAVEVVAEGLVLRTSGDWFSRLFVPDRAVGKTRAVATIRPRDIIFVVDLSSAMTSQTWTALEHLFRFAVEDPAYPEDWELQLLYEDLGFDDYPGALEPLGAPWRLGEGQVAYETLISEASPLADPATNARYRIDPVDSVSTRRLKAYRAVIDRQIMRVMPQARPSPDLPENFEYWAEYLDAVLGSDDRCARIGYASYLRFMLKHGRCIRAGGQHVALSRHSADCTWHTDQVAGRAFRFPPRTQPMHDVRRGLIAAIRDIALRNQAIEPSSQRDRVALITCDSLSPRGAWIEQPLTSDYVATSNKSSGLQAIGERTTSTTGLAGLQVAEAMFHQSLHDMPRGRDPSQLVILVTAGPIQHEQALREQIAKMAQQSQTVRMISAGSGQGLPAGRELGLRYAAESSFRDAVTFASVVLVQ